VTQPQDPRKHPLQEDEIALARVLRALPAGEPPARVDDAILRAATDAVSPGRRKPDRGLRWLPSWAIGTAAAAVLAVGIGIQLRPPLAPGAQPASKAETAQPLPQASERLSVDLIEPDQATAPPPSSAPPAPQRATRTPPPPPPARALPSPPEIVAEAFPAPEIQAEADVAADQAPAMNAAPSAPYEVATESRQRSEASDPARRVHQEAYARRAQAKAMEQASAREPQAGPAAGAASAPADQALPHAGFSAPPAPAAPAPSANAMADAAPATQILPPAADDAKLAPDAWLDRIRERRRQGDSAGARASLRLFLQAHPEAPIPSDLARLRPFEQPSE